MPLANILVYGLGDALNPSNLSTMVIFAALLGWLRHRHARSIHLCFVFITVSYMASLIFLAGGFMNILYSMVFYNAARIIYVIIGGVFIITGGIHFVDWVRMKNGDSHLKLVLVDDGKGKPLSSSSATIGVVTLAIFFSALATVWPPNKFISFYANYINVPGERISTVIMLCIYNLVMIVPLAAAMIWIPWTSSAGWVSRELFKAKIILSSFLIGLGVCLAYIFH